MSERVIMGWVWKCKLCGKSRMTDEQHRIHFDYALDNVWIGRCPGWRKAQQVKHWSILEYIKE